MNISKHRIWELHITSSSCNVICQDADDSGSRQEDHTLEYIFLNSSWKKNGKARDLFEVFFIRFVLSLKARVLPASMILLLRNYVVFLKFRHVNWDVENRNAESTEGAICTSINFW